MSPKSVEIMFARKNASGERDVFSARITSHKASELLKTKSARVIRRQPYTLELLGEIPSPELTTESLKDVGMPIVWTRQSKGFWMNGFLLTPDKAKI